MQGSPLRFAPPPPASGRCRGPGPVAASRLRHRMPTKTRTVRFALASRTVIDEDDGSALLVPVDWALLPPGDPGATRRVKAAGPSWTVTEKAGRRVFSHGVYAPRATIDAVRADLALEREDPAYERKRAAAGARREKKQEAYVEDFRGAVLAFLAFHPAHGELASRLADVVTAHATPVGSGTVARTERIPVAERAEAAVIAWMRHQTTAYDDLQIARVRGERRTVRQTLAERSRRVLAAYRSAAPPSPTCPLRAALTPL
jgi:hypothetical protein